jgi:hypothetical protein
MLKLAAVIAVLANVNLRTEKVGKDKSRPAADLKFTADVPNTTLDLIAPGLLLSLYRRPDEKGHQADLTVPDPATLTTPRYPRSKPWASTEDWPGYFAGIKLGEFDPQAIDLQKCVLKSITAEAKNGGTVALSFTLSGYPTGEDVGKLYDMMGRQVDLTVDPPSIGDLERLRKEQAAEKAAPAAVDPITVAATGDGPPPSNDQVGRAFPDAIDARGDKPPSARRGGKSAGGATAH